MTDETPSTALVAHPSAEMYGADRQCLESVIGLREAGWRVVVTLPGPGPLQAALSAAGADVTTIEAPVLRKAVLTPRGLVGLSWATARCLPRLMQVLHRVRPDVVYVSTLTSPLWVVAAALARVPLAVHVHEAEEDVPAFVRAGLTAPLLLADRVLVNSAASLAVIRRSLPAAARRAEVLYNGVPGPPSDVPGRDDLDGPLRLVLVGRLSPRKGSDVAVDAVGELVRRGVHVTLDLVGAVFPGYEWYEQELRRQVAEAGLGSVVRLRGLADSPWPAMQSADVVLVPSRVEPFGNTAVEAMLCARPVVASRTQGLVEVVRDGVDGVLVPAGDHTALADAVEAIAREWPQARRQAGLARTSARERFSVHRYRTGVVEALVPLVRS